MDIPVISLNVLLGQHQLPVINQVDTEAGSPVDVSAPDGSSSVSLWHDTVLAMSRSNSGVKKIDILISRVIPACSFWFGYPDVMVALSIMININGLAYLLSRL